MTTFRSDTWDEAIWNLVNGMNEYRVNRFAGKIVVDVGAHIGSFSRLAADNGATVVYSFEPNADNYRVLCENVAGTQVQTYNMAVHAASGLLVKSIESLEPTNTGGCGVVLSPDGAGTPTISMDDIIDLAGYVHILKMDCEGGEYPGLLKCTKLNRVDAIVGEYHGHATETIEGLKEHLNNNGFSVGLEPTADDLGHFFAVRL
jgi:FkbM family methyltransferase